MRSKLLRLLHQLKKPCFRTDKALAQLLQEGAEQELTKGLAKLPPEEAAVLGMLQKRLKMEGKLADWKWSLECEGANKRASGHRA